MCASPGESNGQRPKRSPSDSVDQGVSPNPSVVCSARVPDSINLPTLHPLESLGFKPLPLRGGVVTNDLIDTLRDDGPY
jgi:hypothetical protein